MYVWVCVCVWESQVGSSKNNRRRRTLTRNRPVIQQGHIPAHNFIGNWIASPECRIQLIWTIRLQGEKPHGTVVLHIKKRLNRQRGLLPPGDHLELRIWKTQRPFKICFFSFKKMLDRITDLKTTDMAVTWSRNLLWVGIRTRAVATLLHSHDSRNSPDWMFFAGCCLGPKTSKTVANRQHLFLYLSFFLFFFVL